MSALKKYDAIIVGGGLAGLTCALHLSSANLKILLIEKYTSPIICHCHVTAHTLILVRMRTVKVMNYPFHGHPFRKACGAAE